MSTIPPAADRLGARLFGALKDCASSTRTGFPYRWKEKSMKKLAEFGLVEWREDRPGYYATERGLAIASGESKE